VSTLWRIYFENVAARSGARDWRFSQEDVQVSLVWGSQVLQRIAQEARRAENSVLMAEKMATLAGVYQNQPWPGVTLDESWRTLMLSQHHDCWIVPYNGHRNHTWADEVAGWTANTCHRSEEVIDQSMGALVGAQTNGDAWCIQVFNTLGHARTNLADVALPEGWSGTGVKITDAAGTVIPAQPEADDSASHEPGNSDGAVGARFVPNRSADVGTGAEPTQTRGLAERCELGQLALRRQARFMAGEQVQKEQGNFQEPERRSPTRLDSVHAPNARLFAAVGAPQELCFRASCPPLGFSTYRLERASPDAHPPLVASVATNGLMTVETDFYKLVFDADHGGTISSLKAKQLGGRELVESGNARRFNEVRGFFFEQGRFFSNADQPAKIELLENGPVRIRVRIIGEIESNAITQMVSLVQGEPRLDFSVRIDWRDNPGIGSDYLQHGKVRPEDDRKAFYDDRYKLQATFPLNLPGQRIFKDAPFDVTESHLTDTFFQNWSAIKNNLILDWVEAYDPKRNSGVALFSDHTTSYTHDTNHTLGLTLQYAGVGLWGRNYPVQGATEIHYALLPHSGDWERAGVWNAAKSWNEPLMARTFRAEANAAAPSQSLLQIEGDGWEVPTARLSEGKVLVRLFNPSTKAATKVMHYNGPVSKVEQVKLGGQVLREITFKKIRNAAVFEVTLPRLGVGTLRITP
jgi:hypothetical protein